MLRLLLSLLFLPAVVDACGFPLVYNQSLPAAAAVVKYGDRSSRLFRGPSYKGIGLPEWVPLKIYTVYRSDIKHLSEITQRDLSNYVTRALRKFSNMLMVRKTDKVEADISACGVEGFEKQVVSYNHSFVLFITMESFGAQGTSTLATCGRCETENLVVDQSTNKVYHAYHPKYAAFVKPRGETNFNGRPISGHMRVNKDLFEGRGRHDADKWISTMMHEISHALAFSPDLYARYINCDETSGECQLYHGGQFGFKAPSQGADPYEIPGIVKRVQRKWLIRSGEKDHDVHVMTLDPVKKAAAEHFNCPEIDGVELENHGGSGTAFSHLEKRVYEHDTMGGTRTEVNAFSAITLSFFQASGWYKVDYSYAEPMTFGKGKGCDFAMKSCGHWNAYPFCSDDSTRCSEDRKAIEMCNAFSYRASAAFTAEYDYFVRRRVNPSIPNGDLIPMEMPDFCPYYSIFNRARVELDETARESGDSKCKSRMQTRDTRASLQIFSDTARCFELRKRDGFDTVKITKKVNMATSIKSYPVSYGCYEHKCDKGMLWIKTAKSKFYPCYRNGQLIYVERRLPETSELITFQIQCPACNSLCGTNCTDHSKDKEADNRIGDTPRDVSFFEQLIGRGAADHHATTIGYMALLLLSSMFAA